MQILIDFQDAKEAQNNIVQRPWIHVAMQTAEPWR